MLVAIKTADVGWPFPKAFESSCTITLQSALDKSIALFWGTIHWGNYWIYQVWVILRYSMIQLKGLICLEACSNPQSWHSEEVVPLSPWCPMVSQRPRVAPAPLPSHPSSHQSIVSLPRLEVLTVQQILHNWRSSQSSNNHLTIIS